MTNLLEAVRGAFGFHRHSDETFTDEAIDAAVRPSALSVHAQERLAAPDAPRFKPDLDRLLPRT